MATASHAVVRKTVANGSWSAPTTWENGNLPTQGDSVLIVTGTEVILDIVTPDLGTVAVDGTLHGSTGELRVETAFNTAGTWLPEYSRLVVLSTNAVTIDAGWPPEYFDLVLADSSGPAGARTLNRDIVVQHDLLIQFASDVPSVSGSGSVTLGHSLLYKGGSPDNWKGTIRFVSMSFTDRDTSFFSAGLNLRAANGRFVFPRVVIQKNDSSLVRLGVSRFAGDTLLRSESADTIFTVISGALDLQSGWVSLTEPLVASRPVIAVRPKAKVRIAAPLPIYDGATPSPVYDSLHTPLFALDSGSTFEYYSYGSDVIDASYLVSNLVGRAYQNLLVGSNAIASLWANPVTVRGTLRIEYGATLQPRHKKVFAEGPAEQVLTLYGDVTNDAPGPSGASGFYGGIVSSGTDRWIFASDKVGGKDTIHWSGPSQLGSVVIRPNVVLSVRRLSDTLFDSLDILNTLTEEGKPCGGHLLGTVYSEVPIDFNAGHPSDSMHGLGLTIDAAKSPYPSRVRVSRTTGYAPPGADPASRPILRYYATYAEGSTALDSSTLHADFHCDELQETDPGKLNLWRSRERRGAWVYQGSAHYTPSEHAMVWGTSELYPEGTKRPYFWMFAEGYQDTPTPVELLSFSATTQSNGIKLSWRTASEHDISGFEIVRRSATEQHSLIDWQADSSLRARSQSGSSYEYTDLAPDTGTMVYDLYQYALAGARSRIATRSVHYEAPGDDFYYRSGVLYFPAIPGRSGLEIYDMAGRMVLAIPLGTELSKALDLRPGVYLTVVKGNSPRATRILVDQLP